MGRSRINKTEKNLQLAWEHLDDACGSLDNAIFNISSMVNVDDEIVTRVGNLDITEISMLRDLIGDMLEEK